MNGLITENVKITKALKAQVLTSDGTSAAVTCKDFQTNAMIVNVGTSGDTLSGSVMIELEVQDSDDDSTYAACEDADIADAVTGTNTGTFAVIDAAGEDDAVYAVNYKGGKPYFKVVASLTGTHTNGTPVSMTSLQSGAKTLPVS